MDLRKVYTVLSINAALKRLKKKGTHIQISTLQTLALIQLKGPVKVYQLQRELKKIGDPVHYNIILNRVNRLKSAGLITNNTPYSTTDKGADLLYFIEEQLRKIRIDK